MEKAPANSDIDPELDPNFVQAICDHELRGWLRRESFAPYFGKIARLYAEDPQLGQVGADESISIPSRRHAKIADFGKKE
jgi:hypothetical protein